MNATATGGLTITCAKPDCHWSGSPADAPTHDCPTPAPVNENGNTSTPEIGASNEGAKPEPVATGKADHRPTFVIEREQIEQRLNAAGVEYSADLSLDDLRGLAKLLVDPIPEKTDPEPQLGAPEGPPVYDSDPQTAEELGDWLAAHGTYDNDGVPSDDRTTELDARWLALRETVDETETEDAEVAHPEALARPWETVIADELHRQGSVSTYKWLVVAVRTDSQPAQLIARGKTKNEATVAQEDAIARPGDIQGEIIVVKTADVLAAAEAQAAPLDVEGEPAEKESSVRGSSSDELQLPESPSRATPHERTEQGTTGATLFDTDDYRDPTLALPQIDGHDIDRIAIKFGGEIMLDRSDPAHVALWRRVKLGQKIEMWVEAKGLGYEGKGATNKDGELDVIVAKRSVSVQHVRVLGPEDLKEAALEVASQARDAAENQDARDRRPEDGS